MPSFWFCRGRRLSFTRPLLMGVVNVTPDSFSDGGVYFSCQSAIRRGMELAEQGADILDIGGESTRPGASPVSAEEEIRRVAPVLEALAKKLDLPLSIDTTKGKVARAVLDLGVSIINDISALGADREMERVALESGAGIILMHRRGTPQTMQRNPRYGNVVREILRFFRRRLFEIGRLGISPSRIAIDPGIGFGKTVRHNLEILVSLPRLAALGRPLVIGTSRKSFIGKILNPRDPPPPRERIFGTAATVAASVLGGARIIRVHDVREMREAALVAEAIRRAGTLR